MRYALQPRKASKSKTVKTAMSAVYCFDEVSRQTQPLLFSSVSTIFLAALASSNLRTGRVTGAS